MPRLFTSFFLTFFAFVIMLIAYIFLPWYLSAQKSDGVFPALVLTLPTPTPRPTPTPTPSPTPALAPATLIIPKLNIQAAVEHVGITETGNMDVPKNMADVAWYMYGKAPGEEGNAVISGHYDSATGKPAIFYHLNRLEVGDEIKLISINAVHTTFVVTGKDGIRYDIFPNEYVFNTKPGKNVNLITCGGIWDARNRIYTDRLVVYTTLKE